MNIQERNHDTAVTWIDGELEELARLVGNPNASAAAMSAITLAYLLRAISTEEHRQYSQRIDEIYSTYHATITSAA